MENGKLKALLFSIDRIEGELVVLVDESGQTRDVAKRLFDTPPAEGQMVSPVNGRYVYDPKETAARRAEMLALMRRVFGGE